MRTAWRHWAGLLFLCAFSANDRVAAAELPVADKSAAQTAYRQLLTLFPKDRQGYGRDSYLGVVADQPMTYGLVLSAESVHFLSDRNEDSGRRVRQATRWLLDNSDLDHDGLPGWGIPQAWDTFGDGITNPPNHPYTITTAIVLNGFLDALEIPSFWTDAERNEIGMLMVRVVSHWCRDVWSDGYSGGYFWYSIRPEDDMFGINASAMFLGSIARLLRDHSALLTAEQRNLVRDRADKLARAIVATALLEQGQPFWLYVPMPNRLNHNRPNDLVHHVYVLWGAEWYRDCGGSVRLPWTRAQAIHSVDQFWKDGQIHEFRPSVSGNAARARLWGAGMTLAFYAKWGDPRQAGRTFAAIHGGYGQWPRLRWTPPTVSTDAAPSPDSAFCLRHCAHALFGLALHVPSFNRHNPLLHARLRNP